MGIKNDIRCATQSRYEPKKYFLKGLFTLVLFPIWLIPFIVYAGVIKFGRWYTLEVEGG